MTISVPESVKKVLESFDGRKEAFEELSLHSSISKVFKPDSNTPQDLRNGWWAESAAFHFSESPAEEQSIWGTHFGPLTTWEYKDGTKCCRPDIKEIDPEVIDYWKIRANESNHPVILARYADLVWDFSYIVTGQRSGVDFARLAIDAYINSADRVNDETQMQSRRHLERALELAISINDKERIESVKAALFRLFDRIAKPGLDGTWPFLFDCLYENKKVSLTDGEREKIITSLEEILKRSSNPNVGDEFSPWGAQAAAERLEKHYKKVGKPEEAKRVISTYGASFEAIAKKADPLLAMSWLQDVHEAYRERGMKEEALKVQAQAKEKGKNAIGSMKQIVTKIEISKEEMEKILADFTSGDLNSSLEKVAIQLVPQANQVRSGLDAMKKDFPLQALIGVTTIGDGQIISKSGSVKDDPEGRLRLEFSQRISMYTPLLSAAIDKIREKFKPSSEDILNYLYQSPLFDPERRDLLDEGILAYFSEDYVKAIHVLVPQVEHILRRILSLLGQPTNKPAKTRGTMQEQNLNDVLANQEVMKFIPEDLRLYFLVTLADQRGLNIRHRVSHGLMKKSHFDRRVTELLLNCLFLLAGFKKAPDPGLQDESEETRQPS